MNTIKVKIGNKISENDLPKIKYVFDVLGNILRSKVIFVDSDCDILYAGKRNEKCKLFIKYEKDNYSTYLNQDIKNVKYEKKIPFFFGSMKSTVYY